MANNLPLKMMTKKSRSFIPFLIIFCFGNLFAAPPKTKNLVQVDSAIKSLVADNLIVGAQLMVGYENQLLMERNYGVRSIDDSTPVDSETLFCIGSCSKPIASAVIMALVRDEVLDLEQNIDAWLPEFGSLKTTDAVTSRAPTLAELLSHHGGIYSQKRRISNQQTRWIRDFKLNLEDSVKNIAAEPLISTPGSEYAYSGAGYCVLGRVGEVAAELPFESLLQKYVCKPLEMQHTTYFPSSDNPNVATGSLNGKPNPTTPHLSKPFQLPLIGGSLYSTAGESARFLQAILSQAKDDSELLMTPELFKAYTSQYSEKQPYAFGWSLMIGNGEPFGIGHGGALASSRALFRINLESGVYFSFLYTISSPENSDEVRQQVAQILGVLTLRN